MADVDISNLVINNDELEVCDEVGSGSTCKVFKGWYKRELVAIKEMSARGRAVSALRMSREFSKELTILIHLRSLVHPHLVKFIGCTEGSPMRIVSEFCSGGALYDLIHLSEHLELSWRQRITICTQTADAMGYLHSVNPLVIHRDLKSQNLLLRSSVYNENDSVDVKVADFGLARVIAHEDIGQQMTMNVGTAHWKAPELMLGRTYDEKVDVYSFAMVVFECACRELPFADMHQNELIRAVTQGKRPDLDECAEPDCPEVLITLMKRAWDHTPAARPSFSEIQDILKDA